MYRIDRNDWGDLYIEVKVPEETNSLGYITGTDIVLIQYEELEQFMNDINNIAEDIRRDHVAPEP